MTAIQLLEPAKPECAEVDMPPGGEHEPEQVLAGTGGSGAEVVGTDVHHARLEARHRTGAAARMEGERS